jgi:hypothetical protein
MVPAAPATNPTAAFAASLVHTCITIIPSSAQCVQPYIADSGAPRRAAANAAATEARGIYEDFIAVAEAQALALELTSVGDTCGPDESETADPNLASAHVGLAAALTLLAVGGVASSGGGDGDDDDSDGDSSEDARRPPRERSENEEAEDAAREVSTALPSLARVVGWCCVRSIESAQNTYSHAIAVLLFVLRRDRPRARFSPKN